MSGFENYPAELASLDQEIRHYAAVCGVDLGDRGAVLACLNAHQGGQATDKARENLRGLLVLRIKVETEMVELGMSPPPLQAALPHFPGEDPATRPR